MTDAIDDLATPPRRRRHLLRWLLAGLVLLGAAAFVGVGWYYSEQLLPVPSFPRMVETSIGTVGTDARAEISSVAVPTDERYPGDAVWGMWWPTGYGQLSAGAGDEHWTTWDFEQISGKAPAVGTEVLLERTAYPDDPGNSLGLAFEEVTFEGPLGDHLAWHIPPSDQAGTAADTDWAILTHGRGATRRETLRMIGTLAPTGLHQLAITVRNHAGAPATDDGLGRFGTTEWQDLEAGVAYARAHGAERIVLVGFSQGGAITLSYLEHASDTSDTVGVVLDAPLVSIEAVMIQGANELGIDGPILRPLLFAARVVSSARTGLDFDQVEHRNLIADMTTPMLVLIGERDSDVPPGSVRAFAAARPDLIDLEEFPRADHVESWNYDRQRYERAVTGFIAGVLR